MSEDDREVVEYVAGRRSMPNPVKNAFLHEWLAGHHWRAVGVFTLWECTLWFFLTEIALMTLDVVFP